jgi:transcription elongation factor Elf1
VEGGFKGRSTFLSLLRQAQYDKTLRQAQCDKKEGVTVNKQINRYFILCGNLKEGLNALSKLLKTYRR